MSLTFNEKIFDDIKDGYRKWKNKIDRLFASYEGPGFYERPWFSG
jgi:hypothetical protein